MNNKNNKVDIAPIIVAIIGALASILAAYISTNNVSQTDKSAKLAESSIKKIQHFVPLGTIISSTLSYDQLCSLINEDSTFPSKNSWAPADGRSVIGSKYAELNNNVPDLRGLFIRGLNSFYPNNTSAGPINKDQLDPEVNRSAGSFQTDGTRLPNNNFKGNTSSNGEHTHLSETLFSAARKGGGARSYEPIHDKGDMGGRKKTGNIKITSEGSNHNHSIIINSGGDKETRPKNVSVYYYIRINN